MYAIKGRAFAFSIVIFPFNVRFRCAHILRRFFNAIFDAIHMFRMLLVTSAIQQSPLKNFCNRKKNEEYCFIFPDITMKSVLPEILDIQASTAMFIRGRTRTVKMPLNNEKQNEAITKALTRTFTVIHGPPGADTIHLV